MALSPNINNLEKDKFVEIGGETAVRIAGTFSAPAGAATEAKQDVGNTSLASIDTKLTSPIAVTIDASVEVTQGTIPWVVDGSAYVQPVSGTFWQATQPISAASLPLPSGASTAAKQPALGTAGTASSDVITIQGIASMTPLAISASSLPLMTGAATAAKQDTGNTSLASIDGKLAPLGQAAMAASMPVAIASDQSSIPVTGTFWQATQPISGTVAVTQGTAANLNATVVGTGVFAVQATLDAETTKVIGTVNLSASQHIIIDSGSTTAVTGNVTVVQGTGTNLHAVVDSGTISTITNVVHVDDNSGSITVDAPVGTPAFVRLSDGASAITTLPVSLASVPSHDVTNAGTFAVQAIIADGGSITLGAKTDAKSTATDATSITLMQVAKQISASAQLSSTAAKQPALGTAGTASSDVITVQGIASMTALKVDGSGVTQPVSGTFWQATQPVSGTVGVSGTVAVTQSTSPWIVAGGGTAGSAATGVVTVQGIAAMTALKVDGSGVTQPVSATALTDKSQFTKLTDGTDTALVTAAGELNVISTAQPGVDVGDVTINNASGGSAVNIQDGGNSITVDGAVAATQSGTWTVQPGNTANTTAWKVDGSAVTQPISGSVTVTQGTGTNLHAVIDSGTVSTITNVVHVDDNSGSITVDAPVGTPAFVRLSDGAAAITTLPVSLASVPSHAVTNAGTFAVQATLAAETTKVIGTVNIAASQHVIIDTGSTTAVTGNVTVVQGTGTNLHVVVDSITSSAPADVVATGNITTQNLNANSGTATAGSTVATAALNGESTVTIQITGVYTGALTPQATVDGSNWVNMGSTSLVNIATNAYSATIASAATGIYQANVAGFNKFRISALAAVTGTAAVSLQVSSGAGAVALDAPLPAGTAVIGHVIADSGSTTAVTGNVTVVQGTGTNLHTVIDSGTVSTITNVVHVDDNSGSLTVDAPVGTPAFVRLSDGSSAIATLPVSLASVPSHAVTNAGTFAVQATVVDGGSVTLGSKADAKSTATDTTSITLMQVAKQISASVQVSATAAGLTDKSQFTKITDGTDTALVTAAGEQNVLATAQPGVDIGDVTINNASGGSAVNIQDGGNSITVDGTVTVAASVDVTATGNITTQNLNANSGTATAGSTVATAALNSESTVSIQVTGVYTGALTPQATVDGSNWVNLASTALIDMGSNTYSATIASAATGIYQANVAGFNKFRISALAAVTGTAAVSLQVSSGAAMVSLDSPIPAGTAVIGHVIADSGSTTAVTGNVTVIQGTGTNLHTVIDSGTVSTITNVVHVDDNSGSLTIDAPVGTPAFVRLSDGAAAITTLAVSLASVPSHAVTNAGTFAAQATIVDGGSVTLGAKADAKSTATDTTAITLMQVAKQISASVQLSATAAGLTDKSQFTKITDGTDTALVTASGEQNVLATAQPGVDIGDVTINNASGGSAVNIQDGGNSITVDGTVSSTQGTSPWIVAGGGTAGSAATGVVTVQGIASMTAVKVDGSGVTQPVSGTVTVAASTDVTATGNITTQNLNANSGTATAGSTVASAALNSESTVSIQVTGTYTGALTPQVTVDGSNWINLASTCLLDVGGNTYSATIPSGTVGIYQANTAGFNKFRISALAAVTGTAVVSLQISSGAGRVSLDAPIPAGTAVIGHVIADTGSTTAVTGNVTVIQGTGTNLHTVIDSGTVSTITNVVHVDDNSGSITVDAPVGTPAFVRLSDGAAAITTLAVSLASVPSHAVTNAGTFAVQASEADGANVTLGAKADAKSTATDTTAVTIMQVLKQVSASAQLSATVAKQPALGTAGTASSDVISVQGIASMTPLKTDMTVAACAWQAEGNIAFGSLTTSFQTVFTTTGILVWVGLRNNTNGTVVVSLDGGTTSAFTLDAGDQVSLDLKMNNKSIANSVAIQAKYSGSAPTVGTFRVNGIQ